VNDEDIGVCRKKIGVKIGNSRKMVENEIK